MIELIEFVLSGFWVFIGFELLMGAVLTFMLRSWVYFLKFLVAMKHGHNPHVKKGTGK
jgi:hypothetical protein